MEVVIDGVTYVPKKAEHRAMPVPLSEKWPLGSLVRYMPEQRGASGIPRPGAYGIVKGYTHNEVGIEFITAFVHGHDLFGKGSPGHCRWFGENAYHTVDEHLNSLELCEKP